MITHGTPKENRDRLQDVNENERMTSYDPNEPKNIE